MNQVAERIVGEIRQQGSIPFHRFMELALYCPVYGYYEKERDTLGRRGDYYTSVSVGPLFGELLAWQFADWLREGHRSDEEGQQPKPRGTTTTDGKDSGESNAWSGPRFHLVEAGAHQGALARDILAWLKARRPEIFNQLRYLIVEPSEQRRYRQRETLAEYGRKISWVGGLSELKPVRGIIFSNELLDAFPVHRLGWDANARGWFEWGVDFQDGQFIWSRLSLNPETNRPLSFDASPFGGEKEASALPLGTLDPGLVAALPEGFTIELCPAAREWWRQAASLLSWGKLLTIDYGFGGDEQLMPERSRGTLRAYRQHQVSDNLLLDPGEQDLTAHVDFAALQSTGEDQGLRTETFLTQAQLLTNIAAKTWETERGLEGWGAQTKRQFQTLTHPEHLGRAFRVLVQGRP